MFGETNLSLVKTLLENRRELNKVLKANLLGADLRGASIQSKGLVGVSLVDVDLRGVNWCE